MFLYVYRCHPSRNNRSNIKQILLLRKTWQGKHSVLTNVTKIVCFVIVVIEPTFNDMSVDTERDIARIHSNIYMESFETKVNGF